MRQRIILLSIFITLICVACGKTKPVLDEPDTEDKYYSYGMGIEYSVNDDTILIRKEIENAGSEVETGMIIFINGIPQRYRDAEGHYGYIIPNSSGENETSFKEYSCLPVVEDCGYARYITFASMLEPGIVLTDKPEFSIGFIHNIIQLEPSVIEMECENSIVLRETVGNSVKSVVESNWISVCVNDESVSHSLIDEEHLSGTFTVEIAATADSEYIISFWGNGEPVQVGDGTYYKLKVPGQSITSFSVELDEQFLNNIDNLYVMAAPYTIGNTDDSVLKTPTIIVSHAPVEYITDEVITSQMTNDKETTEQIATDETVTQPIELPEDDYGVKDTFPLKQVVYNNVELSLYAKNFRNENQESGSVVYITSKDMVNGESRYFGPMVYDMTGMHIRIEFANSGVVINEVSTQTCKVLDMQLNIVYDGKKDAIFKNIDCVGVLFCYADSKVWSEGPTYICSKNLSTGEEKIEWDFGYEAGGKLYKFEIADLYCCNKFDDSNECQVIVHNNQTGKVTVLGKSRLAGYSEDANILLLFEDVFSVFAPEKEYVMVYNCTLDKLIKIETGSGEATEKAKLSDDGKQLIIDDRELPYESRKKYSIEW